MVLRVLNPNIPHVAYGILSKLDETSLIRCRLVCKVLNELISVKWHFHGKLCDKKLRRYKLSVHPVCSKFHSFSTSHSSHNKRYVRTLVIGKLQNSLQNTPLRYTWDSVEEIQFTGPVSAKNYHALLRVCPNVKSIRINYLAMGAVKPTFPCGIRKPRRRVDENSNKEYELPHLKSIYVDRRLDTNEYIENRSKKQFKHFDANVYFKAMAKLIDDLEWEVQHGILEMLQLQIRNHIADDPTSGFFFTKPQVVNRFPMNNKILNTVAKKLR